MGTSANINVKVGEKYHCTRVNYDGYPEGVGITLHEYYNLQELAERLVSFGELSSLDKSCEQPLGHTYDTPVNGYSVYYGRDRGETETEFEVLDVPKNDEEYSYTWTGTEWVMIGTTYDKNDYKIEYVNTPLTIVLGIEEPESGNDTYEDESNTVFKYFGCTIDEVISINNEWAVTFNTPDDKMTDAYNERTRWMVRHRYAPYQGVDDDGNWHSSFFGKTLYEAVQVANDYLKRGKDYENGRYDE